MPTIVVGDLHGQHEIVDKVMKYAGTELDVVFLGDYVDSFKRGPDDQIMTLQKVIAAALNHPKQVTALKGNHEMSYLDDRMRCSGWTFGVANLFKHLQTDVLEDYVMFDGVLMTHAGVSQSLLDYRKQTLEEYLEEGDFLQIGRSRGGYEPCGGLYWCDFNFEFEPLEGVPQVFGHTRGKGIRKYGNSYCIDCLEDTETSVLLLKDDGDVEYIPVDEL